MTVSPPTVVEVIGLPGSGKSHLIGRMSEIPAVDATQVKVVGFAHRLRLFVASPWLSMLCYACLISRKGVRLAHIKAAAAPSAKLLHLKSIAANKLVLLDEGPTHRLFGTLFGTRSTKASRVLLRMIVRRIARHVKFFLFLKVDQETRLSNLNKRTETRSRFHGDMPAKMRVAYLQDTLYDEIGAAIRAVAPDKLLMAYSVAEAEKLLASSCMPSAEHECASS